ncbi:2-dehydro-3-deoxy-6-phosphogalactonate aldolase [Sphingomonas sp. SM33]|uniref:2-dehydro-3-deoxy-6-phosphogalactonate aldolase n=1 Tax=Sphingomonas telluris TaxID=2907998 RepID=A0ABS9VPB2_9SPHN|nr:2-dehydro-3-deoxy-6-phosphogalactonate aldolase [Sphingomonas telluris]MCH8616548.1 2-dehydro-3-deoxy-6-phosphogalactonate aldolase [Sphingomonas telluris]
MSAAEDFRRYFAECPLVAIIRGVTPVDAEAIAGALYEGGIRIIEVPLNSPDPFESIRIISQAYGDRALVGAGTVLDAADVPRVAEAGGRLVVSPNTSAPVIEATVAAGMVSSPGYFTPSEAFAAIRAGAQSIKLFPAEAASPAVVKAQKAVLPKDVPLIVVGGVTPESVPEWLAAGADGFGLGGGLYKPGQDAAATLEKARAYVTAVRG